jgi:predicted ATPase/DNA-binding SARP family transcriptional activator/DNA-binding CsgD family transcriptional regulator
MRAAFLVASDVGPRSAAMAAPDRADTPLSLRACLLGPVRLAVGERRLADRDWPRRTARELLLLLLATPGHRLPRERALDLLWPELAPPAARNELAKATHALRRVLEPALEAGAASAYVTGDADAVGLRPDVDVWTDVGAFQVALTRAAKGAPPARREALRAAIALYGGDLLADEPGAGWSAARREAVRQTWRGAVLALADLGLAADSPGDAVPPLRALLAADPADEAAHRALMRALAATGQPAEALRQYARCTRALRDELDVPPSEETEALAATLRAGQAARTTSAGAASVLLTPAPLPVPPTPLVGRVGNLLAMEERLWDEHTRLVTLTGPGGSGKTRLALAAAQDVADDFAVGACFVALAPLRQPDLVAGTIVRALGLGEEPGRSAEERLFEALRDHHLLLVLDNLEHLLPAAALLVADLLAAAPRLTVLVTSREALRIRGEHELPVPPLPVPDLRARPTAAAVVRNEAVALFAQRAQSVHPDFAVTDANAATLAQICASLDGLPLALELAAARTRHLGLEELLTRLGRPLDVLTGGPHDAPARLRTMRDAIAWSHDLLAPAEQLLFRRLSVFVGGCTLAAAEEVSRGVEESSSREVRVPLLDSSPSRLLNSLGTLVDKSLLDWDGDGMPRLRMLETIREFGLERLAETGELATVREEHARYFLALAEAAAPEMTGPAQAEWCERLEVEHNNLRAALRWSLSNDDPTQALRLGTALWPFWETRGHLSEGKSWLREALARSATASPALRAGAHVGLGVLTRLLGDIARADAEFEAARALARQAGDRRVAAIALNQLGRTAHETGAYDRVDALCEEALATFRLLGEPALIARAVRNLAAVALWRGDYARAAPLYVEAVALLREAGDVHELSNILNHFGILAAYQGDHSRAMALHQESLELSRALGDKLGGAVARLNLGRDLLNQGDAVGAAATSAEAHQLLREVGNLRAAAYALTIHAEAERTRGNGARSAALFLEVFSLLRRVGDLVGMTEGLWNAVGMALAQEDAAQAARLSGAAEALQEVHGAARAPHYQTDFNRNLAAVRAALDAPAFAAEWATGRALTLDQAMDEATAVVTAWATRHSAAGRDDGATEEPLTRREIEVLRLLAAGRLDREIAAALAISPRTVTTHVTRILAKLGATTRASAAATAVRRGLI